MRKQNLMVGAAGLLALLALASPALAQPDPETLARRCIRTLNELAGRCREAIGTTARHAVQRIDRLQSEGQQEQAERVARAAVERINQLAQRCTEEIRSTARRCIAALERLDADQKLIDAVRDAAATAARSVQAARARAVQAVRDALKN